MDPAAPPCLCSAVSPDHVPSAAAASGQGVWCRPRQSGSGLPDRGRVDLSLRACLYWCSAHGAGAEPGAGVQPPYLGVYSARCPVPGAGRPVPADRIRGQRSVSGGDGAVHCCCTQRRCPPAISRPPSGATRPPPPAHQAVTTCTQPSAADDRDRQGHQTTDCTRPDTQSDRPGHQPHLRTPCRTDTVTRRQTAPGRTPSHTDRVISRARGHAQV